MQLDQIIPWGRSFDEYRRIFNLTDVELKRSILGCGDGPASFNAEAAALGMNVVSCDPIYAFSATEIRRRFDACYETVVKQAWDQHHRFVWNYFVDPDALGRARLAAMERFLADYEAGKSAGRYIAAALPVLPLADHQFELCLCSHLLFLYSDRLTVAFHLAAIREMVRVAREVRVFPLLDLDGQVSAHLEPVLAALRNESLKYSLEKTDYEFQSGDNRMLRVVRS